MSDYRDTDDDDDFGTSDEAIVRQAHRRFDRCVEYESEARSNARKDTSFANADAYNRGQWEAATLAGRGNRPSLTVNKVRQHILQIVNDGRQHKAQIKVSPTGGGATYEAAQVFAACIRRIEAHSKAADAYSTASYHQVEHGKGWVRVVTEYVGDHSFDQDIYIRREPTPDSIYCDPDALDWDKSDMRYAFKFKNMPRDVFVDTYGRDKISSAAPLDNRDDWNTRTHVRVAEYFRRLDQPDQLHELGDGTVVRESDMPKGWKKAGQVVIRRSRDIQRAEVERFVIAGQEIIERVIIPSKYIPLVPWIGEEVVIDGRMDCRGHTRALIDPQRVYNYATSAAAEFVGLQTKTPYVGAAKAVEGYEDDWNDSNLTNKAILLYNATDDSGNPIPRPEREKAPVAAPAYLELMNTAKEEMMMVSGQYQANFGQPSNEKSGVAIDARQRQGDNATYHYTDNQAKGVRQIGRIVLDMIPRVYDVARVIKIMAADGTQSDVHVDPQQPVAHQHVMMGDNGGPPMPIDPDQAKQADEDPAAPDVRVIFNPSVGQYDVDVDVGPAYATQREEAANAFSQLMQQNSEAFHVVGDYWAANSDFPGADELAVRLKRGLPPQYQAGPPPEVKQLQQQLNQTHQTAQQTLQQADHEVASLKAQIVMLQEQAKDKSDRTSTDDYRAETDRIQAVTAADPAVAKVLVRTMLSGLLGMPALPVMQAHDAADAAHAASIAPPDPSQMVPPPANAPMPNGMGA